MQEPCGAGRSDGMASGPSGPSTPCEDVEVLAVAEVAEQQHADVMVADPARGRPDPAREVEAVHPGPGADGALPHLLAEVGERASTSAATTVRESARSPSSHSPTTGSTMSSGPRPEAAIAACRTVPIACEPQR